MQILPSLYNNQPFTAPDHQDCGCDHCAEDQNSGGNSGPPAEGGPPDVGLSYIRTQPAKKDVGFVRKGITTFDGTVQDALDKTYYGDVAPLVSLTIETPVQQLRDTTAFPTTETKLNWSVTSQGSLITSIVVGGQTIVPLGGNQSGQVTVLTPSNVNTVYTITAISDGLATNASQTVSFKSKVYWGRISKDGISSGQLIADQDLIDLEFSELSDTRARDLNGINGVGDYLVFATPYAFGEPVFVVNGLTNTDFNAVRTNSNFVNELGYQRAYNVRITDVPYPSPIEQFKII